MTANIDGIIDAISGKAASDSEKIISLAEQYAAAKISAAQQEADNYKAAAAAETAKQCAFIAERGASNARIDRKKAIAGAKTQIIDGIFDTVRQKLESLPQKEAAKLFVSFIDRYADQGDCAVLSKQYASVKNEILNSDAAKNKNVGVKISDELNPGMLLSGKITDKDLTFAALALFYKESMSTEVARKLFDETDSNV